MNDTTTVECTCHRDGTCRCGDAVAGTSTTYCPLCDEAGEHCACGCTCPTETYRCAYCGGDITGDEMDPTPKTDDEWAEVEASGEHQKDCEWVVTRAHRIERN